MNDMRKNRYGIRRSVRVLMLIGGGILTGVIAPPIHAASLNPTFSFGGGVSSTATRTLTVPAKTIVTVGGLISPLPISTTVLSVPVVIEVLRPEGGVAASINTVALQLTGVPFAFALPPTFISDFGCPREWGVRVRTPNGAVPPLTVSGTIYFNFSLPGTVSVDMEGPSIHLEGGGSSTTPTLAGHDPVLLGVANRSLIQKTEGRFNIRAKWDTAFHLCYLNKVFPLTVALLKPGGTTVATSQTAFSQTTGNARVNLNYTVTPADAMLPAGSWRLRITNNNSVPCGFGSVPAAVDNIDIENLLPPTFNSTFTPQCSEAVGSFNLTPARSTVPANKRHLYALTWTVPDPLSWHDLNSLRLRIGDGSSSILDLKFDEASNTFSILNEATGQFEGSFVPGSPGRLQSRGATLDLAQTRVVGSGPSGPSVTLNLSLSFKPSAAGRTYSVEVSGTDDSGQEDVFAEAGKVTVTRDQGDDRDDHDDHDDHDHHGDDRR